MYTRPVKDSPLMGLVLCGLALLLSCLLSGELQRHLDRLTEELATARVERQQLTKEVAAAREHAHQEMSHVSTMCSPVGSGTAMSLCCGVLCLVCLCA